MDFAESYNHDIFRVYVPKKVKIGIMHPDPVVETSFVSDSIVDSKSSRCSHASRRLLRPPSAAESDRRGSAVQSSVRNCHLCFATPPAVQSAGLSLWFSAGRRRWRGKRTAARWNHRGELDRV